ncbi:MAG: right-handed parallel beta-helix repeat-containing protein, partial [Clostridia bacterium]|nr:right-handed parallel beta-helix repeat-containing protein [Clostridia bacterium]
MKNKNLKKLLSAVAVLAISATGAVSALSFAACSNNDSNAETEPEKLISVDKNHDSQFISTANGQIETKNSGKKYYVAPEGASTNTGESWDSPLPMFEMLDGETVKLQPGDTVYVKPGTYTNSDMVTIPATVSGSYNNYIRIVNAALEEGSDYTGSEKIVTLDFSNQEFSSTQRGIQMYGSYIYWYGIDVCGAGDNGLYIGGSYNTIEYCEFYNNRDTGLQLGRQESGHNSIDQWPSYNLIKNCTSHNNYDNETYGENADGFAAKLTVGYGNVFDGCIAYRNSDDGWDLYAKSDSGNIGCVIIYNCVAFENGYLEYTQTDNNARFTTFKEMYREPESDGRFFRTRDGDGNGFKLGGSVMEGDVVMYNCLSFYNRMHGVTDNSNPGFLKVEGVTSFDNSAAVDDNPSSDTFGQIIKAQNHDKHGNIDVSRQTYSYNTVINTLSVGSGLAESLNNDAYRGSVTDSILYAITKQNVVNGSIDADSKYGKASTSTMNALNPYDIFEQLPIDYTVTGSGDTKTIEHTYNLSGLHDLFVDVEGVTQEGQLNPARVHVTYRNDDRSINMHDILAKKQGVDDAYLLNGKNIGSTLNLEHWGDYTHFFENDLTNGSLANENLAKLERAYETLTINTDANAVYQDFEVPIKLNGCTIEWKSLDADTVVIGTDVENSVSTSKYITLSVFRPLDEDKQVKIVATIKCGNETKEKEFILNIKSGKPSIGAISVVTPDGIVIPEGGSTVIDQYAIYTEPKVQVENGIDYNGKLLKGGEQYTYTTSYR